MTRLYSHMPNLIIPYHELVVSQSYYSYYPLLTQEYTYSINIQGCGQGICFASNPEENYANFGYTEYLGKQY